MNPSPSKLKTNSVLNAQNDEVGWFTWEVRASVSPPTRRRRPLPPHMAVPLLSRLQSTR